MAGSRKRSSTEARPANLVDRVGAELGRVLSPGASVAVALSGGVDSVVLLDILRRLRRRLRLDLRAVHVNHRLSPRAGDWVRFCRRACRRLGVPLTAVEVIVARGGGIEAGARAARYAALERQRCDYVALAHHADDQVETVFLQLLRGAGVKGLAAMPYLRTDARVSRGAAGVPGAAAAKCLPAHSNRARHPAYIRPLLDITREEILAYARARRLEWIEDESNAEVRFRRNYLRHRVLPAIAEQFPGYRATVARSARHLAESAVLLDQLAAIDGSGALDGRGLAVEALRRLTPARARNLLRHFLASRGIEMPGAARLDEALRQAVDAARDARVAVGLGEYTLCRYEGRLYVVGKHGQAPGRFARRPWSGERALAIPELGGMLLLTRARGRGLSLGRLREQPVSVGLRLGGERLQPDPSRPRRTLKNLMQEAGIPPWERARLPLLYCGCDLVWAAGIGADCGYLARAGEAALVPCWCPDDAAGTVTPV